MDSNMIQLILLILIIAFGIIKIYRKNPHVKGKKGEHKLIKKLNYKSFWEYGGTTFNNVYVPKSENEYSEIDVLYLTKKGIFVFENKNYEGYIFGNGNSKEWTVTLYGGKNFIGGNKVNKYKFYNPIWQNRTHVKSLKNYLNTNIPVYSFITFNDGCELKNVSYDTDAIVCLHSELNRSFNNLWYSLSDVVDDNEYERLSGMIKALTNVSRKEKQEHIKNVNSNYKDDYYHNSNFDICPKYGGKLVIRTAKKGYNVGNQFYGCSNYPHCTYTKNID